MAEAPRRYSFTPLDRRGVLVGLEPVQLATVVVGLLAGLAAGADIKGPARIPAAVALMGASLTSALWSAGGRPLAAWVPYLIRWTWRRAAGPSLASAAQLSRATTDRNSFGSPPRLVPQTRILRLDAEPGSPPLGVVHDRRSGTLAGVVPVSGSSFSLLDPGEQERRLDSWRVALAAMGRTGGPLRRVQWVERSRPLGPGTLPGPPQLPDDELAGRRARDSYRSLLESKTPGTSVHEVWLVLSVGGAGEGRPVGRAAELLRRELRLVDGQLRRAGLRPDPPLDHLELRGVLGEPALAVEEGWSSLRVDGEWHATYWVAEWPRVEVPPDFLSPLLVCEARRTVSVIMAPVPAARAVREARSARTADLADAEIRSRAGFLPSVRREREAEGALRRESELAEGYSEFRFSGYVTVSAPTRNELESACAEAEHDAQSAHLEIRRLYGRQAEALTWTLPVGRGLG